MSPTSERRRGAIDLLGAAFVFSLMSLLVKLAGARLPSSMMVLARGVVTLVMSWAWLRLCGVHPWGHDKKRLILRGALGFGGLWCFYYAVTALPLAEVTVIHYLNPVLTAVLAAVLLRERIDATLAIALPASLLGVVLVARPTFLFGAAAAGGNLTALPPLGVAAALAGAMFSAGAYVTVRRLVRTDDPLVIVFYFSLVAVPAALPAVIPAWVWPRGVEWLWLLGIGVTTQVAQVLLTRGLARVPAGRATTLGYTQILFAGLYGFVFFGETPTATTFFGAALIIAAALLIAFGRDSTTAPVEASG